MRARPRFASLPLLIVLFSGDVELRAQVGIDLIREEALGYAVPLKRESLTPVAGFRSLEALQARLDQLWLETEGIERRTVGTSVEGRDIVAYTFSSPGDRTPEGRLKSAALLSGTVHAREWASPEVVTAIFEWLALERETDPVIPFLLDHTLTVIHPFANPDGHLQTERHADRTLGGGPTGWLSWDGRMHRKNMRGVDEDLATLADRGRGVDLNRNHPVGFGAERDGDQPTSEVYRGPAPSSEPETVALQAAGELARLGGESRLRLYVDYHSFGQFYYVAIESGSGRNAATLELHETLSRASESVSGRIYQAAPFDLLTESIGASDEYFGFTHGCPSYTCEIAPAESALPPNGFILPERDIDTVRREHVEAARAALYTQAGPPVLLELEIRELGHTEPLVLARFTRELDPETLRRAPVASQLAPLLPGTEYLLVARFSKPMRLRDEDGDAAVLPGQHAPRERIELGDLGDVSEIEWIFDADGDLPGFLRHPGDTLVGHLAIPLGVPLPCRSRLALSVDVSDLTGRRLDADPVTIADWSPEGWIGYEDSAGVASSRGGIDAGCELDVLGYPRGICDPGVEDCDGDCIPDACAIEGGLVRDDDGDGRPNACPVLRRPSDCNEDGRLDLSDALCLLGHLFLGSPDRLPCDGLPGGATASRSLLDVGGDGQLDLSDPIGLLDHLFLGGAPPALGRDCVSIPGCPGLCAEDAP